MRDLPYNKSPLSDKDRVESWVTICMSRFEGSKRHITHKNWIVPPDHRTPRQRLYDIRKAARKVGRRSSSRTSSPTSLQPYPRSEEHGK